MTILSQNEIENRIFSFRNRQVMVDRDLAEMYGVATKVLNQAVKRNIARFPLEFRFQLTEEETNQLVTNCDRLKILIHSSTFPFVFTEQGIAMLASILRSEIAISVSIQIMNAFTEMRRILLERVPLTHRLDIIEKRQFKTEENIDKIFRALDKFKSLPPTHGIFFDGQVFDAYVFVNDLIKSAKKTLVLIDNYLDESVLLMLSKRTKNVKCEIYTQNLTAQLKLDLEKHNNQYETITVTQFKKSHDRFLIIDNQEVYHIGASLKDLGKKWFAFSRIEIDAEQLLSALSE